MPFFHNANAQCERTFTPPNLQKRNYVLGKNGILFWGKRNFVPSPLPHFVHQLNCDIRYYALRQEVNAVAVVDTPRELTFISLISRLKEHRGVS